MPRRKYGSQKPIDAALSSGVPMAQRPPTVTAPPPPGAAAPAPSVDPARALEAAQQFTPPQLGLGAPSTRPTEPVTAGLNDPTITHPRALTPTEYLKALYAKTRNPDLMDLIMLIERRAR